MRGSTSLLWMFALTTLIAVSSGASIVGRGGYDTADAHTGRITGSHTDTDTDQALDEVTADVDGYLEQFGYYRHLHHKHANANPESDQANALPGEPMRDTPVHHTEAEREEAMRRMQRFFHLRRSGHLDEDTKKIMDAKRCGVQDITDDDDDDEYSYDDELDNDIKDNGGVSTEGGKDGELVTEREITITFPGEKRRRKKRFATQRYSNGMITKWRKDRLTWRLELPSSQMPVEDQIATIRRSFDLWGKVIPIEFTEETGEEEADIRLLFGRGEHGPKPDPVFDGRRRAGNTLAHAWGPHMRSKGFPGDVHFDEDDDWSQASELFIVATHELGHAFGLLHSEDRASIMFPVYQEITRLGLDDLAAVDYLYGPGSDQAWRTAKKPKSREKDPSERKHMTVRPEWITRAPPRGVDTCGDVVVNAFLPDPAPQSKNFYIAVSGDRVHRLSPRGEILQSEPLNNVFPDLPESPDVGLSVVEDQTIFFIKGDTMWAYKEGALLKDFPRSINEMGFPEQPQFSISLQDSEGNDRPLLFGKNYWWMFDSRGYTTRRFDPISEFSRDLPDGVLFVAQWSDRRLYAVTNDSYVVIDSIQRSATHLGPISGRPGWLSPLCGQIKTPPAESDNTIYYIVIAFVTVIAACVLVVVGIFVVKYLRHKYRAWI